MKIPRRRFLHLGAGATALPLLPRAAVAENQPPTSFELRERPLAERLAAYASGLRYDDLGAATIERVKTLVIDTIGCGFGAWDERSVRACREIALSVDGPATIIGTTRRTTSDLATFANCAAIRYLDFNDTYVGQFAAHPSDNIPACLAVAEAERASAQELIVAIVIA
jgi:2-methylcitrate dehydratase